MASLLRRVHAKGGVLMKFELAPSLLRWLLGFVWVESVLMACMGSVSSPSSAIQGSRQSERHQACEASSKCEIRHTSRNKAALRALVRSSAGRSLGGRRAMLALISVAHLDVVEGKCEGVWQAFTPTIVEEQSFWLAVIVKLGPQCTGNEHVWAFDWFVSTSPTDGPMRCCQISYGAKNANYCWLCSIFSGRTSRGATGGMHRRFPTLLRVFLRWRLTRFLFLDTRRTTFSFSHLVTRKLVGIHPCFCIDLRKHL